jgi:hypothetical protein
LTSSQAHRHAPILRSKPDKRCLENVVPPSLFGSLLPEGIGKPARTPPPTFLFLPIHLSKNTMGNPIVWPPNFRWPATQTRHSHVRRTPSQLCIERTEGKPRSRLKGGAALVWRRI